MLFDAIRHSSTTILPLYPKPDFENTFIGSVLRRYVQNFLPCSLEPFDRYRDKLEYESFDPTYLFESELVYRIVLYQVLVEVVNQCRKNEKDCLFCHEGFRKPVPSESVVHFVEDGSFPTVQDIEFDNLFYGRLIIIGQDATISVFAFPKTGSIVRSLLSLDDKVCLAFHFSDRMEFNLKLMSLISSCFQSSCVMYMISEPTRLLENWLPQL